MPTNRSIPRSTNAATVTWMDNFSTLITASPATYGLLAGDAAAIAAVVGPYKAAFIVAGVTNRIPNTPGTRTSPTVAAMNAARVTALAVCGSYVVIIQANPNVLDADKITVGVAPRNFTRVPLYCPATAPMVNIQFANSGSMTLDFKDSLTPTTRAKPIGAVALQLFVTIAVAAAPDPSLAKFYSSFSANRYATMANNPMIVFFAAGDVGKVATFFGRWVGKRGDVGPWSVGASMVISF